MNIPDQHAPLNRKILIANKAPYVKNNYRRQL